jgi:hypothetical protein
MPQARLLERDGNRVWVEAVVATNGIPGRPDSVVEPNPDRSGKIPEEKLVLRYANAISEKYRKYRGYLRDGIIHKNDAFVIAINGAALSYKWTQAAKLRHTCATEMVRLGVSLPALMQLLGHNDIRMTLRYVQVTQQDLQREYEYFIARRNAVSSLLPDLCTAAGDLPKLT